MRVVIADDHGVVRGGMAAILSAAGFEVVGEARDGTEAWGLVRRLRPKVAVLDASLPRLSGLEVARRVARRLPEVKTVMVSMYDDPAWRTEAARAEVADYVLKGDGPEALVEAVKAAIHGEKRLEPARGGGLPLTSREREVVQLIAEGHSIGDAARILCRAPATVRAHKASAMRKLKAHSTSAMVRAAMDAGIVRMPRAREVPRV
ncbi:MAG: response regulator transcription factor [Candidatus Bipolaricaulota bacterium]